MSPQSTSNRPKIATAPDITPFWRTTCMSAAPVSVKITMMRIMNPVKDKKPPKAILNLLLVDRTDKVFNQS
jgi:hypothetical protein